MPGAQSGFLGKLSAERPMLAAGVLAVGVIALCALGVRNNPDPGGGSLILRFVASSLFVVCAPIAAAALTPLRRTPRIIFLVGASALFAAIMAASFQVIDLGGLTPPRMAVGAAAGLFVFLALLAPLTRSTLRLGGVGAIAAVLGVAGGIGYWALDNLLSSPFNGAASAIALTAGICIGAGVGADYAHHFSRGLTPRSAAAAAGHAALAPAGFSLLAVAACMLVVTFAANFGAVDWRVLGGAGAAVLLSCTMALVFTTSALSLHKPSEQAAVEENRRRQRFAQSWRPFRRRLPASAAAAASAIAGVVVVVALFEIGLPDAMSLAAFLVVILIASGLTFVSFRASMLITALLFTSTVFADYIYAVLGLLAPPVTERFAALTLAAIAFSQLTVSWRNAGDIWRNARDIAQNAMSDGLRRFAIAYGAGGAATVACAYAFAWEGGIAAAVYFAIVAGVGLFLAPVLMVALSAQLKRY